MKMLVIFSALAVLAAGQRYDATNSEERSLSPPLAKRASPPPSRGYTTASSSLALPQDDTSAIYSSSTADASAIYNKSYGTAAEKRNARYAFAYSVERNDTRYEQRESRSGKVTQGTYSVLLPDGRFQTVTYTVDGEGGFQAEVRYEGEAVYPRQSPGSPYQSSQAHRGPPSYRGQHRQKEAGQDVERAAVRSPAGRGTYRAAEREYQQRLRQQSQPSPVQRFSKQADWLAGHSRLQGSGQAGNDANVAGISATRAVKSKKVPPGYREPVAKAVKTSVTPLKSTSSNQQASSGENLQQNPSRKPGSIQNEAGGGSTDPGFVVDKEWRNSPQSLPDLSWKASTSPQSQSSSSSLKTFPVPKKRNHTNREFILKSRRTLHNHLRQDSLAASPESSSDVPRTPSPARQRYHSQRTQIISSPSVTNPTSQQLVAPKEDAAWKSVESSPSSSSLDATWRSAAPLQRYLVPKASLPSSQRDAAWKSTSASPSSSAPEDAAWRSSSRKRYPAAQKSSPTYSQKDAAGKYSAPRQQQPAPAQNTASVRQPAPSSDSGGNPDARWRSREILRSRRPSSAPKATPSQKQETDRSASGTENAPDARCAKRLVNAYKNARQQNEEPTQTAAPSSDENPNYSLPSAASVASNW